MKHILFFSDYYGCSLDDFYEFLNNNKVVLWVESMETCGVDPSIIQYTCNL